MAENVVTRIAPSPTGEMHIGTVRTALFNFLFAKQHSGTYFVRIEDTDKERNKEEWVEAIWRDFEWCGLTPDKKYRTSEHLERHRELLHALVEKDKAYTSQEPKKDDPSQTVEVVRLRNPGTTVTFTDLVRGEVTFDTTELGDFVIARSIDDPLYHFAVVVDDGDAGVTHVLRAEEHISNTPRQILILEALGFARPVYGHFPLILAPDRSKLSKRKHGASVGNYRDQGFLAPALINYLALLGWNPGTKQELFGMKELVDVFDIAQVQKSGAVFDAEKLQWFNKQYLDRLDTQTFSNYVLKHIPPSIKDLDGYSETVVERLLPTLRERIHYGDELREMSEAGELDYFFSAPTYEAATLAWKDDSTAATSKHLKHSLHALQSLSDNKFTEESIKDALWEYATKQGRGSVLWPLRYALSGKDKSPDPFTLAAVLGKTETLARIETALELLTKADSIK